MTAIGKATVEYVFFNPVTLTLAFDLHLEPLPQAQAFQYGSVTRLAKAFCLTPGPLPPRPCNIPEVAF